MTEGAWGTAEAHPITVEGVSRVVLRVSGMNPMTADEIDPDAGPLTSGAIALTVDDARRLRDDLDRAIAAFVEGGERP